MSYPTHNQYQCVLSHVQFFVTPQTVTHQAPLRHECWNGLPFPSPGDLFHPGIEPVSLVFPALADGFFTTEPPNSQIAT